MAVSDLSLVSGWIEADITLEDTTSAGRLIFGRDATSIAQYSVGIGSEATAYVIDHLDPRRGWTPVATAGSSANLSAGRSYHVEVFVQGQHVWMKVDNVLVLSADLPAPLFGHEPCTTPGGKARDRRTAQPPSRTGDHVTSVSTSWPWTPHECDREGRN
jgi:hypothetical protein